MATIYLVEDEANIRELVAYTLNASGFTALGFAEAALFYKAVAEDKPDLAILDIMLPGESGLEILARLRRERATAQLPVMMLTAKDTEYDKVRGLDAGADDYLSKPFGMMEMVSRVRALLRRAGYEDGGEGLLVVGDIEIDPGRHLVRARGEKVALTRKEFEVLALLAQNPGIVFTREKLLEKVWDYSYEGETRTVDVHMRSLRQKLGWAGEQVETVRGVGYRLREVPR